MKDFKIVVRPSPSWGREMHGKRQAWTRSATEKGARKPGERNFSILILDPDGYKVTEEYFVWARDRVHAIRKLNRELKDERAPTLARQLQEARRAYSKRKKRS